MTCPAEGVPASAITFAGGFIDNGTWSGYGWTSTEGTSEDGRTSTITPADFADGVEGEALCACGVMVTDVDTEGTITYKTNAILGWNLNQTQAAEGDTGAAPQGTIVPTGTGVVVRGLVTSVVRVQIQTPDGGTNPDERWCYALDAEEMAAMESEDGVRIPWTAFNTTCWEAGGVDYNFEPISTLLLQAKDNQIKSSDTTFEMCLIDVATYEGEDTEDTDSEDTDSEDTETEDTETGDTDSEGTDSAK